MRVFNSLGAHNRLGIVVDPPTAGENREEHFVVRIGALGVLARVSKASFDEMWQRGHAVIIPKLQWSWHSIMGGTTIADESGRVIFCCDTEVQDNGEVWLIPEKGESKDLLAFFRRDAGLDEIHMTPSEGTTILAEIVPASRSHHYCVVVLKPESRLDWHTSRKEELPAQGMTKLNPRRKRERVDVPVKLGSATFNGDTLAF